MYDKEAIYDEKISPLMDQIINICTEHQIHMLASFYLKEADDEGGDMCCTTYIPSSEGKNQKLIDCHEHLFRPTFVMAMTITNKAEGSNT